MVRDLLIKAHCELIFIISAHRHGLVQTRSDVLGGNELLHQIGGNWILARGRNHTRRKDRRPSHTCCRRRAAKRSDCVGATGAAIGSTVENTGQESIRTADASAVSEAAYSGEISAPLRRGRNIQHFAGNPLSDTTPFIGNEEKTVVFPDRPTDRPAELVLIPLRSSRIEVALRVQDRIAEVLEEVAVKVIGS